MKKAKAIIIHFFFSELDIAKELASITCVLTETRGQAGEWETFTVENGEASSVPWLDAVGMRKPSVG